MKDEERQPLPQIELTPEAMDARMDKWASGGTRATVRYGDTEYETWPNRDPRLDEIEDWPPGQMR